MCAYVYLEKIIWDKVNRVISLLLFYTPSQICCMIPFLNGLHQSKNRLQNTPKSRNKVKTLP